MGKMHGGIKSLVLKELKDVLGRTQDTRMEIREVQSFREEFEK